MQHYLDLLNAAVPTIVKVIGFLAGAGVIDFLMRKFPTKNPVTILTAVRKVLNFISDLCKSLDQIIDAVPGMKQNLKEPEAK